jgi:integrase
MTENKITVWITWFKDRGSFVLQWRDPENPTKIKSKSAETDIRGTAEMKRTILEADLNRGFHKEASRMSWEKFRQLFLEQYVSGKRKNTQDNYAATFDAFERLCRPSSLRGVTALTISSFVGALRRQGGRGGGPAQESTIKVRLQFLHTALAWAVKKKMIPECPHFDSIKPPKRRPQAVPVESFERLIAKTPDEPTRVFLLAGWLAGLRLAEACQLEWEETDKAPYLDLARDRIILPAGFVKGCEDQWVPLDRQLRAALLALPRSGRKVFHFVDQRNGKLKSLPRSIIVSHRISELAKKAGVRLTMKSLRRGFGCYWAARVPAQVLQKLMRHANIKTTMDYYVNVDRAAEEAILGREALEYNKYHNGTISGLPESVQADGEHPPNPIR